MKRASFVPVLLLLLGASFAAPLAADAVEEWEAEVGASAGHHDNFFYRGESEEQPSENLYSLYGQAEAELNGGPGSFIFSLRAAGVATTEIEGSDYQDYAAGAGYKIRNTRLRGGYQRTPQRVFSESGEGTFFDFQGRSGEIRQGLRPGLWIGGEATYETWTFDAAEADRDATVRGLEGTLRIPLGSRVGARASAFGEKKEAAAPEHDWDGRGYSLALEVSAKRRVSVLARYKLRKREYRDAPSGDSNFGREDTLRQVAVSLRILAGDHWGIQLEDSYRDNDSTRPDRIYDGNQYSVGFFATWGGPAEGE